MTQLLECRAVAFRTRTAGMSPWPSAVQSAKLINVFTVLLKSTKSENYYKRILRARLRGLTGEPTMPRSGVYVNDGPTIPGPHL